jgi:molybdopterin synthase sulfur carrier subunit
MIVKILYFARLREDVGRSEEEIDLPESVGNVKELRSYLVSRGGAWAVALAFGKAVRVSVNHDLARDGSAVKAGDEIAFFPPVTGG